MISVHPIRGGAQAGEYYLERRNGCEHQLEHPADRAGYYTGDGRDCPEAPGWWLGRGAEALGLTGGLDLEGQSRFRELLQGRFDGQQLAKPVLRYGPSMEPTVIEAGPRRRSAAAVDVDAEEQLRQQRGEELAKAWHRTESALDRAQRAAQPGAQRGARDVRVAAYDVTLSSPKSVSVLRAMTRATSGVDRFQVAHRLAAEGALDLLEGLSARAARGHHGDGQSALRIETAGFIGAAFDHTTSRALDPQLHTHVVVMNLVHGVDGRWSALDSLTLYRQATTASYLYQHLLRAELTRQLGIQWGPLERGVAEIVGVPKAARREFSTRRAQIEAKLAETDATIGLKGRAKHLAARAACLATRPAKRHVDAETLTDDWHRRGRAKGFGPEQADQLVTDGNRNLRDGRPLPAPIDRELVRQIVLGQDGVTRERATFDQGTVLRELISALPPGADIGKDELLAWTRELLNDDSVVQLAGTMPSAVGPTYTTRGMLAAEDHVLTLATRVAETPLAALSMKQIMPTLFAAKLRPEQRDLAQLLLTRGRPVDVVTGPAGSGKTHSLAAAVTSWTSHGIDVRGTAVAALTAQGLQDATGADSVSLTRLLNQPDKHLPTNGVLLVDEAGMIGTHQLLRLLQAAERRDCKVVLVGDPAQLPEIEAGGAFARLTRGPGSLRLDGHSRQGDPWEREALMALRGGNATAALDAYQQHGRLHLHPDRDDLKKALVGDYLAARSEQTDPWQVAVLAPHRRDVTDLNSVIRTQLISEGVLSRRSLKVTTPDGPVNYRKGDQVIVSRNHHDRGLLNGTRGTVRTLKRDGLVVQLTDGRRVTLDKSWLSDGDLDHGYAMTLHKAQGRTVHTSLVLGDQSLSQEGGYVGLSRGTSSNHLYLNTDDEQALRDCSPRAFAGTPTDLGVPRRALTRSSRHDLALDLTHHRGPAGHHSRRDGVEGPSR